MWLRRTMTSEQLYCFAMIQVLLVFLLASFRLRATDQNSRALPLLQAAIAAELLSWLFYFWPAPGPSLVLSLSFSALNMSLLTAFCFKRSGRAVPWLWIVPVGLALAFSYSYFSYHQQQNVSLHLMTLFAFLLIGPCFWCFRYLKPNPTLSDLMMAAVFVAWLLICLLRSFMLLVAPEWLLSGLLISQSFWPAVSAGYCIFALTGYMEETQQKFKNEALHDPLTGLLNRRGLVNAIQGCLAYLQRQQHSAALFMIDLDHFKQINDKIGHEGGDEVLIAVAEVLQKELRQSDVLARYGGEEFIVFLPQTDSDSAQLAAERLLLAVRHLQLPQLGSQNGLSISVGITVFNADFDFDCQLRRADHALYQAKARGRDRIEFATDTL
ncbi:GGDEF domain-containing protein [Rheinheimera sp. 1928-s]|uniref:GGDEF domain-containing protein n=1 Tax=Rheinheimera sp. 1928-s TaxID=3033803 RepID=UPI00261B229D|nr:GGDEF domain-containing protein [Rheinheimera sp. 1928-s]MDF3125222.1 GGDEF domain-containing protein [Rheinheimera sp. 1928-s]